MRTVFLVLILCLGQIAFAQVPKDYHNKEIKEAQRATAIRVLRALQNGNIKLAKIEFNDSIQDLDDNLLAAANEIRKVRFETEISIVIVYEEGFNVYLCRYYNDSGSLYQMKLYLQEGKPDSKIERLKTKDSETLRREREIRMNTDDSQIPPPPPPPPPPR